VGLRGGGVGVLGGGGLKYIYTLATTSKLPG